MEKSDCEHVSPATPLLVEGGHGRHCKRDEMMAGFDFSGVPVQLTYQGSMRGNIIMVGRVAER